MTTPTTLGTDVPMPADKHREAKASVLVVDDVLGDRRLAGAIIEQENGWTAVYADNGQSALTAMERELPHLVLTDLQMPEMDGLQLLAAIRRKYPLVPVVIMTAHGNEEIAIKALLSGAASYVPKRILDRDLVPILEQVLAAAQVERRQLRMLAHLSQAELHFTLDNDHLLIPALVAQLQPYLSHLGLCDHSGKVRVGVALEEALLNAIYHGNLEVDSSLRQHDDEPYHRLADLRRVQSPFGDRRVYCCAKFSPIEAVFVIRDEGSGFDPTSLPDPTDPANMEKASGRGLLLIRTFMDDVSFNDTGNQITMTKRRERRKESQQ